MRTHSLVVTALLLLTACTSPDRGSAVKSDDIEVRNEQYSLIFGGSKVGELEVTRNSNQLTIQYAVDNNGRGSSGKETLLINALGVPVDWQIDGVTTFGSEVDETFAVKNGMASWDSAAGEGKAEYRPGTLYVAQNASLYANYVYLNALLQGHPQQTSALPAGTLSAEAVRTLKIKGRSETATLYALKGLDYNPTYLLLDADNQLIAVLHPRYAMIRKGLEGEEKRLRESVAKANATRLNQIADRATHSFDKPLRIDNVHVFQPRTLRMSELRSVVVEGNRIVAIEPSGVSSDADEVIIDGKGGYLLPGLFEMHGHLQDQDALLNVLAGITSVRDMGNEADVIEALIQEIKNGQLIGPRVTKSAFIEGKSPFSNATGELVSSEQEAVNAVTMYAERGGYHQVKIYNSIKGEWVPAMVAEAKKHGMRVAGHVPAFSKADEMIQAGYNEMTHINQVMLGWVLSPEEDTRTLFRITGMKRFNDLDLSSEKVQKTLTLMLENNVAIDPTISIHEAGMLSRNGKVWPALENVIEHLPISEQRRAKAAMLNIADDNEDRAYRQAYKKIIDTLTMMHDKGIMIVPGTDLGGAFFLHRELALFTDLGMTPAEALKRGSYDMANYLGYGDSLGSIEQGKLADFFLVESNPLKNLNALNDIPMVVKDGNVYFPAEIYPQLGVVPFTGRPEIKTRRAAF